MADCNQMTRFVLTHRRAGRRADWEHRRAHEAMAEALGGAALRNADLVGHNPPRHDHERHVAVFDAEHGDVRDCPWHEDLIVEPHMPHYAGRARPPEVGEADEEELAAHAGEGRSVAVRVTDASGAPLAGVDVFAYFGEGADRQQVVRRTDGNGEAEITHAGHLALSNLAAVPASGYWPMIHSGTAETVTFACPALPGAERGSGWWHRRAGFGRYAKTRGRGIRVGVIDTGVGPHDYLSHVHNLGSVLDAQLDERGGADIRGHGSHVAGIIGARPAAGEHYGGLAPGATLYAMRVFGKTGGAHQGDIALAIWAMAHERRCHLINLSLGTPKLSDIERDAIADAAERGAMCICAAGNTGGEVEYPAAFEDTLGVTALGWRDWGPEGSLAAHRRPEQHDRHARDGLYLANFSCYGKGVDVTGPGVGIISTVRGKPGNPTPYAAYGGTSMATPYVTGVLAAMLSRDAGYRRMPRDETRVAHARERLRSQCHDVGLEAHFQGHGLARK